MKLVVSQYELINVWSTNFWLHEQHTEIFHFEKSNHWRSPTLLVRNFQVKKIIILHIVIRPNINFTQQNCINSHKN